MLHYTFVNGGWIRRRDKQQQMRLSGVAVWSRWPVTMMMRFNFFALGASSGRALTGSQPTSTSTFTSLCTIFDIPRIVNLLYSMCTESQHVRT
jgi:hypothetical protein